MTFDFHPEARAEYLASIAYYEDDRVGLGSEFAQEVEAAIQMILAYPGEGHHLGGVANQKDLTVRFMEFFDHYLKGAPAPKWLSDGVPYLKKDEAKTPPKTEPAKQ